MWSPSAAVHASLAALALVVPLVLSGCTGLTPVYGDRGLAPQGLAFAYADPPDRLSQIVMQDLALRLGRTEEPDAPRITVSASVSSDRALTRTGVVKPHRQYEVTVRASYSVVAEGRIVASGTRRGIATYTRNSQVLADDSAYRDAQERAARAAADSVRLGIIAQLGAPARPSAGGP